MQIAFESNVSDRTVRRYMDGQNVLPVVEEAIKKAAKKLKIKIARANGG